MKRVLRLLPGVFALMLLFVLLGGLGAWLFLPGMIAEQRARDLAPAPFPRAALVQDYNDSITGAASHRQIFVAPATLVMVHGWFEQRMPGFSLCDGSIRADCFSNERCDESAAGQLLSSLMFLGQAEPARSCVSIILEPELPSGRRTIIHVNLSWPSDAS
jgi:hypothetical protein